MGYDYSALGPLAFPCIAALLVLAADGILSRDRPPELVATTLASLSVGGLLLAVYTASLSFDAGFTSPFHPARPFFVLDPYSSLAAAVLCLGAVACVLLSTVYLSSQSLQRSEYYALLLLSTGGGVLAVGAVDLVLLVLAIELAGLPLVAMAGFDPARRRSHEAASKALSLHVFGSGLRMYGAALLYGAAGDTSYAAMTGPLLGGEPLALLGLGLFVAGLATAAAAAPFHFGAPDVAEGSPSATTVFLATVSRIAAFAALLRLLALAVPAAVPGVDDALRGVAVASMLLGALLALVQQGLKRLLAFASVAHMGFLVAGLAAGGREALGAAFFEAMVTMLGTTGVFAVAIALAQAGRERERVEELSGLGARHPWLAGLLALFLLSLSALPGTGGFMGRFGLLSALVSAEEMGLALAVVLASALLLAAYLRILAVVYMRAGGEEPPQRTSAAEFAVLAACGCAVLFLGLTPDGVGSPGWLAPLSWVRSATAGLGF